MKLYKQTENITVMGVQVTTFPNGIKEAFGSLMETLGRDRAYYGISWMDESDHVKYYAMAKETFPGERKQYNYESLNIEKGEYLSEVVHNWISQTGSIKDVLHSLMANKKPDKIHPCIEWYISDEEMLCMVKA